MPSNILRIIAKSPNSARTVVSSPAKVGRYLCLSRVTSRVRRGASGAIVHTQVESGLAQMRHASGSASTTTNDVLGVGWLAIGAPTSPTWTRGWRRHARTATTVAGAATTHASAMPANTGL